MSGQSTTPDLVKLIRRFVEAMNRRNSAGVTSLFAPDAIFDMSPMGMGTFEGLAAKGALDEDWWGAYEEFAVVTEELDLSNDDEALEAVGLA